MNENVKNFTAEPMSYSGVLCPVDHILGWWDNRIIMKTIQIVYFLAILGLMPALTGCISTQNKHAMTAKEQIMSDYLSQIERNDGINRQEAVLLARSELIFRGYDKQYSLSRPLIEHYDEENYLIQFFSSNKTLGQMIVGAAVSILVNKTTGDVYLEEHYQNPGRYHAAS